MSLVGPKPKTVAVTIKVDTSAFRESVERLRVQTQRLLRSTARCRAVWYREVRLPIESWENEGGAL